MLNDNHKKNTKIVATLGPASSSRDMIEKLFLSGVDVFRINFSHSTHKDHAKLFTIIREIEKKHQHPIAIMADLQGPKLRVGLFNGESAVLDDGQEFRLYFDENNAFLAREPVGNKDGAVLAHPEIFKAIKEGSNILINDGNIKLYVKKVNNNIEQGKYEIITKVVNGGVISDRKGVNVPDVLLDIPALTGKDKLDLNFALDNGADWIALSFVQRKEDVLEAREIIGDRAKIISKIEKPQAIKAIDDIMNVTDAVMVARGDLGVEVEAASVPILQKSIVSKARALGKPVIIATQMLESMTKSPVATRAEASDVATAVFEGSDAVMLSAESASGLFPEESVTMMRKIINSVESAESYSSIMRASHVSPKPTLLGTLTNAAYMMSENLGALAMITVTASGNTAMRLAKERPTGTVIVGLTQYLKVARQLALVWGVTPVHREDIEKEDSSDMKLIAKDIIGYLGINNKDTQNKAHDYVIMTTGVMFGVSGTTDTIKVIEVS